MPTIARLVVKGEPSVYHVISRTALDGFVLGDIEKDYLLKLIKRLSSVYFSAVLGFCVMGNHYSNKRGQANNSISLEYCLKQALGPICHLRPPHVPVVSELQVGFVQS